MNKENDLNLLFQDDLLGESGACLSDKLLDYFKNKLLSWRDNLQKEREKNLEYVLETPIRAPDHVDAAKAEMDRLSRFNELKKEKEMLEEIDAALGRIEGGTYGFCEETGGLIDLNRLEAWPIARFISNTEEDKV